MPIDLHVFPRVSGDEFGLTFGQDYFTKPSRAALDQVGARIRATIEPLPGGDSYGRSSGRR
jgi:hypothetical protein